MTALINYFGAILLADTSIPAEPPVPAACGERENRPESDPIQVPKAPVAETPAASATPVSENTARMAKPSSTADPTKSNQPNGSEIACESSPKGRDGDLGLILPIQVNALIQGPTPFTQPAIRPGTEDSDDAALPAEKNESLSPTFAANSEDPGQSGQIQVPLAIPTSTKHAAPVSREEVQDMKFPALFPSDAWTNGSRRRSGVLRRISPVLRSGAGNGLMFRKPSIAASGNERI